MSTRVEYEQFLSSVRAAYDGKKNATQLAKGLGTYRQRVSTAIKRLGLKTVYMERQTAHKVTNPKGYKVYRSKPATGAKCRNGRSISVVLPDKMVETITAMAVSRGYSLTFMVRTLVADAAEVSAAGFDLHCLPEEVKEWLVAQTPEGASIKELIRAIIIDAYNEEN